MLYRTINNVLGGAEMKYYKTTTEFNCGVDLHSERMYMCLMNREGKVLVHREINGNDFAYFMQRVEPYKHDLTVTCECTFNWPWFADACHAAGLKFILAHAFYLRTITNGKHKNDREDSKELADVLRTNRIPPAYVYPKARRAIRNLLRRRISFVALRAHLLGHLQCEQMVQGLKPVKRKQSRFRDSWFDKLMENYDDPDVKMSAEADMFMVKAYDDAILKLETRLLHHAKDEHSREFQLLQTIPGIGEILALTILYEIDDIHRFPTVQDFSSYCRLVKGTVASAGKIKGARGGKMGNGYLKWAFRQAAILGKRDQSYMKRFAQKLEYHHGKHVANAVMANKMARAVYFMLHSGKVFDPIQFTGYRDMKKKVA